MLGLVAHCTLCHVNDAVECLEMLRVEHDTVQIMVLAYGY